MENAPPARDRRRARYDPAPSADGVNPGPSMQRSQLADSAAIAAVLTAIVFAIVTGLRLLAWLMTPRI